MVRSKFEYGVLKNSPYRTNVTYQKKFCVHTVPVYFSSDGTPNVPYLKGTVRRLIKALNASYLKGTIRR